MTKNKRVAYPDLEDPEEVYNALLGYGMFAEKLPPCFCSKGLLDLQTKGSGNHNAAISYKAKRNTPVSRQLDIPHPEPYLELCKVIKDKWKPINEHIGKPEVKFSFGHVRKISGKNHIFEMSYGGEEKKEKKEIELSYHKGCTHVVKADISSCFPSIYAYTIAWAILGKDEVKKKREKKKGGKKRKRKAGRESHWSDRLERRVRNCNEDHSEGILIGPHASSVISEIILTRIDVDLQDEGFKKVTRYIDDYVYFAKDENDAKKFISDLENTLKKYLLSLNNEKTKIIPLRQYIKEGWPEKLKKYKFRYKKKIKGLKEVLKYLDYAISLEKETKNAATINYAIKVIHGKQLKTQIAESYTQKILNISLTNPYLLPLLEKYVLSKVNLTKVNSKKKNRKLVTGLYNYLKKLFPPLRNKRKPAADMHSFFTNYLGELFKKSVETSATDGLAYCFYFALKYEIKIKTMPQGWQKKVIALDDCVSILLAWKYAEKYGLKRDLFEEKKEAIKKQENKRDQDLYWLFLYETSSNSEDLPPNQDFLRSLKEKKISFINFNR